MSATVSGLPTNGATIHVRLWSCLGGKWSYDDYTYEASSGVNDGARLTSPPPGTTLASPSATFEWTADGVSQTALYVGTTGVGSYDLYAADQGTALSATVSDLPGDGSVIYVRLWSRLGAAWQYADYIYRATTGGVRLTTPAPRSTLTSSTVTLAWSVPRNALGIRLYVGVGGPGSYDICSSTQDLSGLMTVGGLPTNGETVYVRLWAYFPWGWRYNDYTYATGGLPNSAQLTAPVPGSTLTGSGATLRWTAGSGVSQIFLYVGTEGPGSYDIYCAPQGTSFLGTSVSGLPTDGRTVYVRLWSYVGGRWRYEDYTYQAVTGRARLQAPAPGSALTSSSVTFGWTEAGEVREIALSVGTTGAGSYDIYSAYQGVNLSAAVSGLPTDGRTVYVRLWSSLRGGWQDQDHTYRSSLGEAHGARLTSPSPGATFESSTVTFGWSADGEVAQTALYVGTGGVGSYDLYAAYQGTALSATVPDCRATAAPSTFACGPASAGCGNTRITSTGRRWEGPG